MANNNVVSADLNGGWSCVTAPLWQWDYGQVLEITGIDDLPSSFVAHCANRWDGSSQTVLGSNGRISIPNDLLTSGEPVYVWIVLTADGTDGETKYKITIPVNRRAAPTDYPTTAQQSAITQAINALNTAAANAAAEVAAELVDPTLSVSGKAADAAKTGEELGSLKSDSIPFPTGSDSKYGTNGQLLRTKGNGLTEWADEGLPTDEQTAAAVQAWLDEHPEATTTVQDGSITPQKFSSNAISVNTWSGSSSINNWSGDTLEDKLCDFLENATNGSKLDLQGQKITITKRFVKTKYTSLNNTVISNGIFEIPASIGGWLSIGSTGGYRVPIFNNCVFTGGGSIFYEQSYNFKAIGCVFYDTQIIGDGYVQACSLVGCNVMNRSKYLIECDWCVGLEMTNCSFEAGNVGVFKGNGNASYASLVYGMFKSCIFEGFTDSVLRTNGVKAVNFDGCYVEAVPYLIYDTDSGTNIFYVSINGGIINSRNTQNMYTIYSKATYMNLFVSNLFYDCLPSQYLSNAPNSRKQIITNNHNWDHIYGANDGKNQIVKNDFAFTGTEFSFATTGTRVQSQPQAFVIILASYATTIVLTKVSILTLNYRLSTGGYTVTETPIVSNDSISTTIDWSASADDISGVVTISGVASSSCSISVVNLGSTMSGMIL